VGDSCPYEAREIDARRGISVVHSALWPGMRGYAFGLVRYFACEFRNSTSGQVLKMMETFAV